MAFPAAWSGTRSIALRAATAPGDVTRMFAAKCGRSVVMIPKAGLRSMRHALAGHTCSYEDAMKCDTRLAFIRNPIERLKSGFSHFFWRMGRGTKYNGKEITFAESWPDWVDHILEYDDEHWHPQTSLVGDFANTWHRFEDVLEVWGDYFPGFFPHYGKGTRKDVFPYRQSEIETKYADDLDRWHSL